MYCLSRVVGIVLAALVAPGIRASSIDLSVKSYKHIVFESIPATAYTNEGASLKAEVDRSASFLLLSFEKRMQVKTVSFEWRAKGRVKVKDSRHEQSKAGDDALLRIGLILHGDSPMVPFFAPAWVKAVKDHLKHSSDRLFYLVVGAKTRPGESWTSPYGDSITIYSADSHALEDGWKRSVATFSKKKTVVGLWIMADGDNTKSPFTTFLRKLELRP